MHTVLEKLREDIAFDAPETTGAVTIDVAYVRGNQEAISGNMTGQRPRSHCSLVK